MVSNEFIEVKLPGLFQEVFAVDVYTNGRDVDAVWLSIPEPVDAQLLEDGIFPQELDDWINDRLKDAHDAEMRKRVEARA